MSRVSILSPFLRSLHLRFGLVFLFFTLCDNIAAFCTSYNGVNVCVGVSLYIHSVIRGIYDVDMYYLLSSIFTGSHICYKNVTFIFEF